MTEQGSSGGADLNLGDRRSSVRVRSMLPISVQRVDESEIPQLEAQILDMAVLESESVLHDFSDWTDRNNDEIPREMIYVLNEIRALRMQVGEMQRAVERQGKVELQPHWIELNDQGLWIGRREDDANWELGEFAKLRLQIPSIHTPEILAVGKLVRIDEEVGKEGEAFVFQAISQAHRRAISRYALRRDRQQARSVKFTFDL